jgi:hypothetical protein
MRKKTASFSAFILSISVLFSLFVSAKDPEFKFGKVFDEEVKQTLCPIDSNAHAYYLFDVGSACYYYNIDGFKITYLRHFRIKIVDKAGLDYATVLIPYYYSSKSKELVSGIKAVAYNWEGNKIVKSPIEKKAILEEETSKNWYQKKFAIPNVKEGTVIEVSYEIQSDLIWSLDGWQFQYQIPVLYSNFEARIPEYFEYNQSQRGYFTINTQVSSSSRSASLQTGGSLFYTEKVLNYTVKNCSAFPVGEELTTPQNYLSKVDFELASFQVPGVVYKDYTTSWADVNKLFLEDEDFGLRLKYTGYLDQDAKKIMEADKTELGRMKLSLALIKEKIGWNGKTSCYSFAPLKKSFETGVGSSGDINLNLVALLNQAGLIAYPVVMSTRSNGMIHHVHASINQMNYVIAACRIGDDLILLDATDKYSEPDILPTRCLNEKGLIIDKEYSDWVQLLKGKKSKETVLYNLQLSDDGIFKGKISITDKEFKALYKRNRIKSFEAEEKYIEYIEEQNEGLNITGHSFENIDSLEKDLFLYYDVEINGQVEVAGNLMYFTPLLYDAYKKNPFSLETREYPVEYPYPIGEAVIINITLPEGYAFESVPKNCKLLALENNCQYLLRIGTEGKSLMISSSLQINQTLIPGNQYAELKSFFEQVVAKQMEKIVLKKIG